MLADIFAPIVSTLALKYPTHAAVRAFHHRSRRARKRAHARMQEQVQDLIVDVLFRSWKLYAVGRSKLRANDSPSCKWVERMSVPLRSVGSVTNMGSPVKRVARAGAARARATRVAGEAGAAGAAEEEGGRDGVEGATAETVSDEARHDVSLFNRGRGLQDGRLLGSR